MPSKESKEALRMQQPPHPLPVIRKGGEVKVYMGAGWQKGTVRDSSRDHCTVYCNQLRRTTTCRDARNIILL